MIKERADELIAALRSGKYKQGRFKLNKQDAFCCLGVACDISGLGKWDKRSYMWGASYTVGSNRSDENLTRPVRDYFGFGTSNGGLNEHTSLASLNDQGKSFSEIADFIEQNWEQL